MSSECEVLIVANIQVKQGIRNHFASKSAFQLCLYFESSCVKFYVSDATWHESLNKNLYFESVHQNINEK